MIGNLIGLTWIAAVCYLLFVAPKMLDAGRDVNRDLP